MLDAEETAKPTPNNVLDLLHTRDRVVTTAPVNGGGYRGILIDPTTDV